MAKEDNINQGNLNRRRFLKSSALGLGAAAIGGKVLFAAPNSISGSKGNYKNRAFTLIPKEFNSIDEAYEISPDFKRMDQRDCCTSRMFWDEEYCTVRGKGISTFAKHMYAVPNPLENQIPGWNEVNHALSYAASAGQHVCHAILRDGGAMNDWDEFSNPMHKRYTFGSSDEAAKYIKRAVNFFGGSEIGIAPYDERWTYKKWFDVSPNKAGTDGMFNIAYENAEFPFEPKSVIAINIEMDYDAVSSPGSIGCAATDLAYSQMTEVAHKTAVFLNSLGYKALPCGNDTSLSIPIAVQAGLGELSRMGSLISPKFGSRVRICKVYTDLEMSFDKPIRFGVQEFCTKCKKCAEICPSKAISMEDEPTYEPTVDSISTLGGIKKWYHNNEFCADQWERFATGCGYCLGACPYNKLDTWVHDLAKVAIGLPVSRDIARVLDDAFGYGKVDEKKLDEFWNKKI